jgi:hypothetical protein
MLFPQIVPVSEVPWGALLLSAEGPASKITKHNVNCIRLKRAERTNDRLTSSPSIMIVTVGVRKKSFFMPETKTMGSGGRHSTAVAFVLLTQPARVRFSSIPVIFLNVAEINWRQRMRIINLNSNLNPSITGESSSKRIIGSWWLKVCRVRQNIGSIARRRGRKRKRVSLTLMFQSKSGPTVPKWTSDLNWPANEL